MLQNKIVRFYKIKKVNYVHLFCPKSTMNLTYLCYGESNIYFNYLAFLFFRRNALFLDEMHFFSRRARFYLRKSL